MCRNDILRSVEVRLIIIRHAVGYWSVYEHLRVWIPEIKYDSSQNWKCAQVDT